MKPDIFIRVIHIQKHISKHFALLARMENLYSTINKKEADTVTETRRTLPIKIDSKDRRRTTINAGIHGIAIHP